VLVTVRVDGIGTCATFAGVLDITPEPCHDVHTDGKVTAIDLQKTAQDFGPETSASVDDRYDVNRDGVVSSLDLATIAAQFGRACR
jgi:hypothetical protein